MESRLDANVARICEPLRARDDIYEGKIIDASSVEECTSAEDFAARLAESLNEWRQLRRRGVWLEISGANVDFIRPALRLGFNIHHADPPCATDERGDSHTHAQRHGTITLTYWIPGETGVTNTLPSYATHSITVGAIVINKHAQVLAVKERMGPVKGLWKMPTGIVNDGEDACDCVVREVTEETGVRCKALKLLALREAHDQDGPSGRSNIFMVFLCAPENDDWSIVKQESEIAACKWMQIDEFLQIIGTIWHPETLYYVLTEIGCRYAKGQYGGMDIKTLPIGHYGGENRVYLDYRAKL